MLPPGEENRMVSREGVLCSRESEDIPACTAMRSSGPGEAQSLPSIRDSSVPRREDSVLGPFFSLRDGEMEVKKLSETWPRTFQVKSIVSEKALTSDLSLNTVVHWGLTFTHSIPIYVAIASV